MLDIHYSGATPNNLANVINLGLMSVELDQYCAYEFQAESNLNLYVSNLINLGVVGAQLD